MTHRLGKVQREIVDVLATGGHIHFKTGTHAREHGRKISYAAYERVTLWSSPKQRVRKLTRHQVEGLIAKKLLPISRDALPEINCFAEGGTVVIFKDRWHAKKPNPPKPGSMGAVITMLANAFATSTCEKRPPPAKRKAANR